MNVRLAGPFFKVPHHGSKNADCTECWTELLSPDPIAVLTPYARSRLPTRVDIERLCSRSPSVYLTSDPVSYPLPMRDNAVEKTIRGIVIKRRALCGQMGHVRLRCDAARAGQLPEVHLNNGARQAHIDSPKHFHKGANTSSRTRCREDAFGNGLVEEVSPDGFADVGPQIIPGVALGEDVEGAGTRRNNPRRFPG